MIKVRAIKPKAKALQLTRFGPAAKRGLRDAAEEAQKLFERTTRGWGHSVEFGIKEQKDGFVVGTDDEIWTMLDAGTKPHRIEPRHKKRLRFQASYRAKTAPGRIGSGGGGPSGDAVFSRGVNHPGTKPRGWSKLIKKQIEAKLQQFIQRRIREAM